MKLNDVKKVLPLLMQNNIVPFLWGSQGIGKTQSVKQVAKSLGGGFVHLHLATQEVGDLVGLLKHNADSTVSHARPSWMPTEGAGIIFLDEFNRMHPDVMQAMFSFITDKTIHTHKLPENWHIVAAGNYDSSDFQVTNISDAAFMSRFCHIDFKPSKEEFVVYADSVGANSVSAFIRDQPLNLESESGSFNFQSVKPDRRSWVDFVAKLEMEPELQAESAEALYFELLQGIVGTAAASAFLAHKKTQEQTLTLAQILKNYKAVENKIKKASEGNKTRLDLLNGPVTELLTNLQINPEFLKEEQLENLKQFILEIPMELKQRLYKELNKISFTYKSRLVNDYEFVSKSFKVHEIK